MTKTLTINEPIRNVYCATGEGGGKDPSCSSGLYHGTSVKSAKKILKEGLNLSKAPFGAWVGGKPVIYATTDLKVAQTFAEKDWKTKQYAVIHLKPGVTPDQMEGNTAIFKKDIPPSKIAKVEIYKVEFNEQMWRDESRLVKTLTNNNKAGQWLIVIPLGEEVHNSSKTFVINQPVMSCCGMPKKSKVHNVYCATGEGGGIDPSCSPGKGGLGGSEGEATKRVSRAGKKRKASWFKKGDSVVFTEDYDPDGTGRSKVFHGHTGKVLSSRYSMGYRSGIVTVWLDKPVPGYPQSVDLSDQAGLRGLEKNSRVHNVYCPTGEGGGIDPTCSKEGRTDKGNFKKLSNKDLENLIDETFKKTGQTKETDTLIAEWNRRMKKISTGKNKSSERRRSGQGWS